MTYFHASTDAHATTGDALIHESDTVHVVCCNHPDTTLCGIDASDADLADGEDEDCVVCIELFDESPEFCPVRPFCPLYVVPA